LLLVSVGCLSPTTWGFETEMAVGAGAHAEAVAKDVATLLSET